MTEQQNNNPFADVQSSGSAPRNNGGASKKNKTPFIVLGVVLIAIVVVIALVFGMRGCSSTDAASDQSATTSQSSAANDQTQSQSANNAQPVVAEEGQIVVSVTVDGTEGGGQVWFDGDVAIEEGGSAYDALEATGLQISTKSSLGMGVYVMGIEGLMEKEQSSRSGWLYAVNDSQASQSSDKYVLQEGDSVSWYWRLDALGVSNQGQ